MRPLMLGLMILLLTPPYSGSARLDLYGRRPQLRLVALPAPVPARIGRLTWLGGLVLRSDDSAFGGLSALAVRGGRLLALGDGGNFVGFALDAAGRPSKMRFGALPDGPRTGWEKGDRDSESLTLAPGGRAWVGFEGTNQIWRYDPGLNRAEQAAAPPAMRHWQGNGGAESLVRLRDGRFVTIAETTAWPGRPGLAGIVFSGDPAVRARSGFNFSYRPAPGFAVSDMTLLPDGDLLVLERRWSLPIRFRNRLVRIRPAQLKPGASVRGREVGRIGPPFPTENYEGIAALRQGGATIVWLVSDNDQSWWRPTYLIRLRID